MYFVCFFFNFDDTTGVSEVFVKNFYYELYRFYGKSINFFFFNRKVNLVGGKMRMSVVTLNLKHQI